MALLLTLLAVCIVECAVLQGSASSDISAGDATSINKLSGQKLNDNSGGHSDRRRELFQRMLQLSSGLHSRPKLDLRPSDSFEDQSKDVTGDEKEGEGRAASLRLLMRILSELSDIEAADARSSSSAGQIPQKRTCRFNLGGHCATEEAVNMANQWHFFNSPFSPGRRRRNTASVAAAVGSDSESKAISAL